MRFVIILSLFLMHSFKAEACSLMVATESMTGTSMGQACVDISEIKTDGEGPYRILEIESSMNIGDENSQQETKIIRSMGRQVLVSKTVPFLGNLAVITLRSLDMNNVALDFLNGNSLAIQIDQDGRTTPSQICVKQSGHSQVRGYANSCP